LFSLHYISQQIEISIILIQSYTLYKATFTVVKIIAHQNLLPIIKVHFIRI